MSSAPDQSPALLPPPGQVSDLTDLRSFANLDRVCVVVCLASTTTLLVLRSYVRLWIKRQWVFEDYMCWLSWALLSSFLAMSLVVMKVHGGVHGWDLTKAQARVVIRMYNIASIIYGPAILCTKVSILLLYRRTFSVQKRSRFDRGIRLFILLLTLFYITNTFLKIYQCRPRARIWNKSIPGTCLNLGNVLTASGVFNTSTDLLLLIIPIRVSWNLNTSKKRKMGVVLLFTFGFLAPVFSIVGLAVRIQTMHSLDVTYDQPEIILWGAAEITTGLICVCVPPLAALVHPTHHQRPRSYRNPSESGLNVSTRRNRPELREERDLFTTSSDVELQYNGAAPGVGFPRPVVTTSISTGRDRHEGDAEKGVVLEVVSEKAGGSGSRSIDVTTTIRSERYYL